MAPQNPTTRERLLTVAARHFAQKGFAATSLRDIGKELSMANASLLYHFPSKRRMYAAVLEQIAVSLEEVADTLEQTASPGERRALVEALLAWASAHPQQVRIVNRELLDVATEPKRASTAKRWYLAGPVDRLAAFVGGRQRHVELMHMVGSISYFAVAAPTLSRMLGRDEKNLTRSYRKFVRARLAPTED